MLCISGAEISTAFQGDICVALPRGQGGMPFGSHMYRKSGTKKRDQAPRSHPAVSACFEEMQQAISRLQLTENAALQAGAINRQSTAETKLS